MLKDSSYQKIGEQSLKNLKSIVGEPYILTQPDDFETYSHDETANLKIMPCAVVKPASAKEISEIMKFANSERIPIIPRGAGTGLSGGATPCPGGIVLSLERLNKIIEIDTENMMAVVEPAVINGDLGREASKSGLFYPPDPASIDSCSIGGNIAECAGGARTLKYGTTKHYVTGLEAVLPLGNIINCGGKLLKNVAGYDLIGLLVGSEGTLAVVTQAVLKLLPLPKERIVLLIPYNDITSASASAFAILRQKARPSAIEFLERSAVLASEFHLKKKLPYREAGAQLFIELDADNREELDKEYDEIGDIALKTGALDVLVAKSKTEQDRIWESRRCMADALKEKYKMKTSEDVVVPRNKIPELLKIIKEIELRHGIVIVNYGHIGDGNVHVNILSEEFDPDWSAKIEKVIRELFDVVIRMGGTISGEHGIGLTKKPYLGLAIDSAQLELMKDIKKVFDPNNILNPGKIF